MRIRQKFPWKAIAGWTGGVLSCIGIGYLFYLNHKYEELPKTEPIRHRQVQATSPSRDSSTPPREVQIELPGATPITARTEDYNSDGSLWQIVNQTRGFVQPHYVPSDLQVVTVPTLPGRSQDERSLRAVLMSDLQALVSAAEAAGSPVRVGSGYRSYQTQVGLFDRYVRQVGEARAAQFSARPGFSEHQSGLALDFGSPDGRCWVDDCFENTAAGKWLAAHAHEYGFILRYPKGKQSIVGYKYESWHYRYVGRELAGALQQSGLTLEEAWPHLEAAMKQLRDQGKI